MKKILLLLLYFPLLISAQNSYYNTCVGLSGLMLKQELHNIIKDHSVYSYSQVKDILKESDEDPNNSENIILVYTGNSINKLDFASNSQQDFWNREHVWPKSHGDFGPGGVFSTPAFTDVHNLKPSDVSVNSLRSDKDFDVGGVIVLNGDVETECFSTNLTFEPRDDVKGDIARIIFYMDVRYESGSSEPDLTPVDYITNYPDPEIGILSTLLSWHVEDPPDLFEQNRNDVIYSWQGNRNPFIDFPDLVDLIYNNNSDSFQIIECVDSNNNNICDDIDLIDHFIILDSGWSLFSTYIDVNELTIQNIFSQIEDNVIIIKDEDGNVYWPEYNLNSIGEFSIGKGYQIKMSNSDELVINGVKSPYNYPILLSGSWNILGYLHQDSGNIETMLNSIEDNLIIIKDEDGNVYWPEYNLNSIGDMLPGEGYHIKILNPSNFIYSDIE